MGIQINGQTDIVTSTTAGGKVTIPAATFPSVSNINATGVSTFSGGIVVSSGSTAAPSISPSGNSNTGIFFPSPDTVAIAEGGVEALRVDSNGNLGIGTNNPDKKLVVKGSGGNFVAEFSNTNNASSNNGVYINVQNTASATQALNVVSGGTSRLCVNGTGNIGVGTDNPTYRMLIYGTSNSNEIRQSDGTVVSQWYQDFNGVGYFGTVSNHPQVFRTVGTDRVTIDTSGRVTMPYQPGFKIAIASRNATGSGRILSTDAGDSFLTDRDYFNTGNHFTTSNGRFTAPVTGKYMFIFSFMRNASNGTTVDVRFQKNTASGSSSNIYSRIYKGTYSTTYEQNIGVTITQLNTNDYVNLYIDGGTSIYYDDTYFAGYLIG